MKEQDELQDFSGLDQDLKAMASDVPEMPESFRAGWRAAVRAEAAKQAQNADAPREEIPEAPAKKISRLRRWAPLVSTAAALLFLVTGTLATRGVLSPRLRQPPAAESLALPETERAGADFEEPIPAPETANAVYAASEEADAVYAASEEAEAYAASGEANAAYESAYAASEEADEAYESAYAASGEMDAAYESAYAASGETDAVCAASEEAEEAGAVSGGADPVFGAARKAAEESAPSGSTAVPAERGAAPSAAPSQENDSLPSPAPDSAREDFGTRVLYFLEDMGAFLWAALPFLLGAALLVLLIFLIRRKKG